MQAKIPRQLFFYVTLFLFLAIPAGRFVTIFGYNSDILTQGEKSDTKTYSQRHLQNLRQSVFPRYIHLIDTQNSGMNGTILQSGVLFTYKNYQAREVYFISSLDRYKKHKMYRNSRGVWYYLLPRTEYESKQPEKTVRYKYVVDGLYVHDTSHDQYEDDRAGGLISLYYLDSDYMKPKEGILVLGDDTQDNRKVLFRFYAPNARYVSLIGSFNNWDSGLDRMQRTKDGYFEIVKSLPEGEYVYLYRVDETIEIDKKPPELKYHPVYGRVGYFNIK
ncbi:MAG: hypothetical protein ABUK01_13515 [Leptospirales bacterium]